MKRQAVTRSRRVTRAKVGTMWPSSLKEDAALATTEELPQAEALNVGVVDRSSSFINVDLTIVSSLTLSILVLVICMGLCLALKLRVFSSICHWLCCCCCGQCLEARQEPVPIASIRLGALGAESSLAARQSRVYPTCPTLQTRIQTVTHPSSPTGRSFQCKP